MFIDAVVAGGAQRVAVRDVVTAKLVHMDVAIRGATVVKPLEASH